MKAAALSLAAFLLCAVPAPAQGQPEDGRVVYSNAYAMLYKGWDATQREYFVSGYILGMDYARRAGHLPRTSYGHKAVMPLMDFCYTEGRCMHLAPGEIIEASNLEQGEARSRLAAAEEALRQAFLEQERKADARRLEELHREQEQQRRAAGSR